MATAPPVPNSSTGGYLVPTEPPTPLYAAPLEDVLSAVFAGLLGWDQATADAYIRPRWQPEPPDTPEGDVDWLAFGIEAAGKDWDPFRSHDPGTDETYGTTTQQRDEWFTASLSFYGPNSWALQSQLQDGIELTQNREALNALGIKVVEQGEARSVPALLKQKWYKRVDQRLFLRRRVSRNYTILNIVSAGVEVQAQSFQGTRIESVDAINPIITP